MNLPLIIRRIAQAEFDDAVDWYEGRQAGRGTAFAMTIRRILAAISSQPERYPLVFDELREALVPGYPFVIHYRRLPDRVTVYSIFHTSRDPTEWQKRI